MYRTDLFVSGLAVTVLDVSSVAMAVFSAEALAAASSVSVVLGNKQSSEILPPTTSYWKRRFQRGTGQSTIGSIRVIRGTHGATAPVGSGPTRLTKRLAMGIRSKASQGDLAHHTARCRTGRLRFRQGVFQVHEAPRLEPHQLPSSQECCWQLQVPSHLHF